MLFRSALNLFTKIPEGSNPREIVEAIFALSKLNEKQVSPKAAVFISKYLSSTDPAIRHTAYRALAKMSAHEAAFSKVNSDDTETRKAAAWALMRMHKKEVVDGLLVRLKSENIPEKRRPLLSTLARLYHKEAEWKGD